MGENGVRNEFKVGEMKSIFFGCSGSCCCLCGLRAGMRKGGRNGFRVGELKSKVSGGCGSCRCWCPLRGGK